MTEPAESHNALITTPRAKDTQGAISSCFLLVNGIS